MAAVPAGYSRGPWDWWEEQKRVSDSSLRGSGDQPRVLPRPSSRVPLARTNLSYHFSAFWLRSKWLLKAMTDQEEVLPTHRVRLRNTVRFEMEEVEKRKSFNLDCFVKDILKGLLNVQSETVYCLQDFSSRGFFDLTLFSETACFNLHNRYLLCKDAPALQGISLLLLYSKALCPLTVHLYNPFVREEDIVCFLLRYCSDVRDGVKLKD